MSKELNDKVAKILLNLTYNLRTNMTSITRYVKHERSKNPTLTEGQFVDRHLEYRNLANEAVDNILKCLNDNEELKQVENVCFKSVYRKHPKAEWIVTHEYNESRKREEAKITCSSCGHKPKYEGYLSDMNFCPKCGAVMIDEKSDYPDEGEVLKEFIDRLHTELRMYGQDDTFNKAKFLTVAENIAKEMSTK